MFDLPIVAALAGVVALPTKIAVDVVKAALPRLPGGVLPLLGVLFAFGIALLYPVAADTPFSAALVAQCGLAALLGQGGAMLATGMQTRAEEKRIEAGVSPSRLTPQDLR